MADFESAKNDQNDDKESKEQITNITTANNIDDKENKNNELTNKHPDIHHNIVNENEHLKDTNNQQHNSADEEQEKKDNTSINNNNNNKHDTKKETETILSSSSSTSTNCENCKNFQNELNQLKAEKIELEKQLSALKARIETVNGELEREVQRRCDLEQRFTEEAKRSTDQIEELIAKSDQDDVKISEFKKKFDLYIHETSSMIENFTTNREVLTSQLLELRQENDYLLGKYIGKSRDLQNEEINLPQTVDELQFHCLTLNEKLILATLAKEQLEETLMQNTSNTGQ